MNHFYSDFYEWERAVEHHWPNAQLNDIGNPRGIRSYFEMSLPPGHREVARWRKSDNNGWVK